MAKYSTVLTFMVVFYGFLWFVKWIGKVAEKDRQEQIDKMNGKEKKP